MFKPQRTISRDFTGDVQTSSEEEFLAIRLFHFYDGGHHYGGRKPDSAREKPTIMRRLLQHLPTYCQGGIDILTSQMDVEKHIDERWTALFKFINFSGNEETTLGGTLEYPAQLLKAGKVGYAFVLAKAYKKHWDALLEALGKPKGELSLTQEDWVKGQKVVSQQDWYIAGFMPAVASSYFDIMDTNKDCVISITEWRDHYTRQAVKSDEFIRTTFAKMDTNNGGFIFGEEFELPFVLYGKDDSNNDYSFLYTL